ncbi:hypothetical protein Droror1_Dr00022799 [Drosera rotundifolia]
MITTYKEYCGALNSYGMKYTRAFANICNAGVGKDQMARAAALANREENENKWRRRAAALLPACLLHPNDRRRCYGTASRVATVLFPILGGGGAAGESQGRRRWELAGKVTAL